MFCDMRDGVNAMISQLNVAQTQIKDGLRPPAGAVGGDRTAGAVPPEPSPEIGPPNPRMRIDRDLGMVVIEFRDAVGRLSVSLPTPREIEAYRASILFGADMPFDMKALSASSGNPGAARPAIPLPPEPEPQPAARPEGEAPSTAGLNKIA